MDVAWSLVEKVNQICPTKGRKVCHWREPNCRRKDASSVEIKY